MGNTIKTFCISNRNTQQLMGRRLTVEVCENLHIHWRNARIEIEPIDIPALIQAAQKIARLPKLLAAHYVSLPINSICPWDINHRPDGEWGFTTGKESDDIAHRAGIDYFYGHILGGVKPWPIAVRPLNLDDPSNPWTLPETRTPLHQFQRLDGFKRYMAHEKAGATHINAFLLHEDSPGCQDPDHGLLPSPFLFKGKASPLFANGEFKELFGFNKLDVPEGEQLNRIEELANGSMHVHLGDLRLEFSKADFQHVANLFIHAKTALDAKKA
jgi:hypothetical protein